MTNNMVMAMATTVGIITVQPTATPPTTTKTSSTTSSARHQILDGLQTPMQQNGGGGEGRGRGGNLGCSGGGGALAECKACKAYSLETESRDGEHL
jgi:hypothetical protein